MTAPLCPVAKLPIFPFFAFRFSFYITLKVEMQEEKPYNVEKMGGWAWMELLHSSHSGVFALTKESLRTALEKEELP